MDAPQDFEALKRRLAELTPQLPKRLRQVAAYAINHPNEVALGTASSVAARADVQASTLVRFAQALGFAGFSDLQGVFRAHLRTRWPDYSERLKALKNDAGEHDGPLKLLLGFAEAASASLSDLKQTTNRRDLEAAIDRLARAGTIFLLGQRRSFGVAHYLAYVLAQLKIRSTLIDNVGGLGPEQFAAIGPRDALIAVSFAPYARFTVELTQAAKAAGAAVIVVTDNVLSPLAQVADVYFEVAERDFGAFRSQAATLCLAMTLAVGLAEKRTSRRPKPNARSERDSRAPETRAN